jgi:hypothetical protein
MRLKKIVLITLLLVCTLALIGFADKDQGDSASPVFTGNEDHSISLEEAAAFTFNYRQDPGSDPKLGGFFGGKAIQSILDQEGCVGIRYYYGKDNNGAPVLIIVGVDKEGNDLYRDLLAEKSVPCPPCGSGNNLNGQFAEEMALSGN